MEHGLQKVEVFVKGPGSGRETAIRSLQAAGLEIMGVKDVTPQAHNGVPAAQAAARLAMARMIGPLQAVPPRGHETVPQGRALPHREVRHRAPRVPARPAWPRPHEAVRVPHPAAREAEGAPLLRRAREAVPQLLREGQRSAPASPARTCCGCSSCASTTWCTGSGFAASRAQARQLVRHGHFQVNGRRVNIPRTRSARDVVSLRDGSTAKGSIPDATDLTASVPPGSRRTTTT